MKENDENEKGANRREEVGIWFEEIKTAKKREKDFRDKGEEILEIYEVSVRLRTISSILTPKLYSLRYSLSFHGLFYKGVSTTKTRKVKSCLRQLRGCLNI